MAATAEIAGSKWNFDFEVTEIGKSIDVASMKMLKAAYNSSSDKNIVCSPLTAQILLTRPTYWYSWGKPERTDDLVAKALGGTNYNEVQYKYNKLINSYESFDPNYLSLKNSVFTPLDYRIGIATIGFQPPPTDEQTTPKEGLRDGTDLIRVDYKQPSGGVDAINQWASNETKGLISKPITSTGGSNVYLSEVFFKGEWKHPIDASEITEKEFRTDAGTSVKKPMMRFKDSVRYRESSDLSAKLVEIPFKEHGYRLMIILPNAADGLESMLDRIAETGMLKAFSFVAAEGLLDFELPKFEIKSNLNLNDILSQVGVSQVFESGRLTFMRTVRIIVDRVFQDAVLNIYEKGATAAAVTGIVEADIERCPQENNSIEQVTADHPFLYAILHEDKIMIAGTYAY